MRHWKIIGAIIALLGEGALQVSGFTSLPLAIILGVVCVGLLSWSAWPVLKRVRFQKPIRLTSGQAEANPKTKLSPNLSWLEQLAEQDYANLAQRIKVEPRDIRFDGLENLQPEFEIIVSLTNTSVFKVNFQDCIGFVQFENSKVEPKILDKPKSLIHSESTRIHLRFPITSEAARWLRDQADDKKAVGFTCSECLLFFQVNTQGYESGKIKIPLVEGQIIRMPKGSNIL